MDERDHKAMNEELNQSRISSDCVPRHIFIVTNKTERTVESVWYCFEVAKKECKEWEEAEPQSEFMVVEMPIN